MQYIILRAGGPQDAGQDGVATGRGELSRSSSFYDDIDRLNYLHYLEDTRVKYFFTYMRIV